MVAFTSYVTQFVLFAAYLAFLPSSLALQHRDMPFRNIQVLVYDGSYKLGVLHNIVFINICDVRYKNSSDHIVIPFVARSDGASSEEYKRY